MKQKVVTNVYLAITILVSAFAAAAQNKSTDEVIKIDTALVSVPVIVSDRQGRYVPNLAAKDFALYQDDVKQKIEFFAATEEPLSVALLIDTSRSTTEVLGEIKDATFDFLRLLEPRDKAMIVSFDFAPHVLSRLTADREQLQQAVETARIGEQFGTTLRDALFTVVNDSFAKIKGRKAVVLLTDGKDFGSSVSTADLLYSLEESDTLVYTIYYQTAGAFGMDNRGGMPFPRRGPGGMRRGGIFGGGRFPRSGEESPPLRGGRAQQRNQAAADFLQQLSDKTAGRFYSGEVTDLKNTFGSIVEELRYQYRLGFYPPDEKNDGVLRELKVKVARPDVTVRARSNYRVQSARVPSNSPEQTQ